MGLSRYRQSVIGMKISWYKQKALETYYGGSPLAINHSGELVLAKYDDLAATKTDTTATTYVGAAYNPSAVDATTYNGLATFLPDCSVVTLCKNSVNTNNTSINKDGTAGQTGDDYPYDTALTWDEGDLLFINTVGKWTNVNPSAGKPCYGTVLESGTNYITVLLYGGPAAIY